MLTDVARTHFTGRIRSSEKGYLFYSVGINGKDEEGLSPDDNPPGGNLPVRMPLPELKAKK
jgi:hypothetical protein